MHAEWAMIRIEMNVEMRKDAHSMQSQAQKHVWIGKLSFYEGTTVVFS